MQPVSREWMEVNAEGINLTTALVKEEIAVRL
jgi:hypothetical protein